MILQALPVDRVPIVAAGGFATGAQIAAMLTLGASSVALGTRFILTPESRYSQAQKAALLTADSSVTKRSIAWDQARNTVDWPLGIDGRGICNQLVKDFDSGVDMELLRKKVATSLQEGNIEYQVIWSGTGVGEMSDVQSAKVRRLKPCRLIVYCVSDTTLSFAIRISCVFSTGRSSNACKRVENCLALKARIMP